MKIIGVDVGGTFTDLVYCDMASGSVAIHKVSTTPDDPSRAIVQGTLELCRQANVPPQQIDFLLHGTTTATNAVLEHKGAQTKRQIYLVKKKSEEESLPMKKAAKLVRRLTQA